MKRRSSTFASQTVVSTHLCAQRLFSLVRMVGTRGSPLSVALPSEMTRKYYELLSRGLNTILISIVNDSYKCIPCFNFGSQAG